MFEEESDMGDSSGGPDAQLLRLLLREVRELRQQFTAFLNDRVDDSREHGTQAEKLSTLAQRFNDHEAEHRGAKKLLAGAIISSGLALGGLLFGWVIKLVTSHPDIVK